VKVRTLHRAYVKAHIMIKGTAGGKNKTIRIVTGVFFDEAAKALELFGTANRRGLCGRDRRVATYRGKNESGSRLAGRTRRSPIHRAREHARTNVEPER